MLHNKNSRQNWNILRTKRAFDIKQKAFFIIFKGLSSAKNCIRPACASLILGLDLVFQGTIQYYTKKTKIFHHTMFNPLWMFWKKTTLLLYFSKKWTHFISRLGPGYSGKLLSSRLSLQNVIHSSQIIPSYFRNLLERPHNLLFVN